MGMTKKKLAALTAAALTGLGGLTLQVGTSGAASSVARATLRDGLGNVVGEVVFKRHEGQIVGRAEVQMAADSGEFHGFHIHANDGTTTGTGAATGAPCVAPTFTSVGSHWQTAGTNHGSHIGDLPVLMRDASGHAEAEFVVGKFEPGDIIGRAVIVHVGADNYANIPPLYGEPDPATTLKTGDAGARFACGVIMPRSG